MRVPPQKRHLLIKLYKWDEIKRRKIRIRVPEIFMELQVEHLFVFFSITHFARKNKRGRKKFWIRELYEKGTGDSGSRIRFPDEIFQTGDQDLQRGGNRRESRRE